MKHTLITPVIIATLIFGGRPHMVDAEEMVLPTIVIEVLDEATEIGTEESNAAEHEAVAASEAPAVSVDEAGAPAEEPAAGETTTEEPVVTEEPVAIDVNAEEGSVEVTEPMTTEAEMEIVEAPAEEVIALDAVQIVEVPLQTVEGAMIQGFVDVPVADVATESMAAAPKVPVHDTGEKETISVDFPDEDVRTILRNVAELFDMNLVIPDALQGRTSLKLRNVTWPQVFEVVLEPLGFVYIQDRNIVRIRSKAELAQEPMDTRVFLVNYARAEELTASIMPLIDTTLGGQIKVDRRTNALVITERPSRMTRMLDIINRLDRPTSQVMIQSKFVEIRDNKGRDLGLDWGSLAAYGVGAGPFDRRISREVDRGSTNSSNNQAGSSASNSTQLSPGGFTFQNNTAGSATNQSNANDIFSASRSRLDTAVFSADQLSVVLNAIQQSNDVRLVSNPTVVTMDGESARIKITRDFPQPNFTFNAQTGQRQFNGLGEPIEVGITLDVKPAVNNDGFINLEVVPTVSASQESIIIEGTPFPIIDTREVKTRITIKDGFTLALGGLRDEAETTSKRGVPFLSDIPAVGRMFQTNSTKVENTNLIIFITARTLNPDGTTYEDVIDPRQLNAMRLTRADIPGYDLPAEEREQLARIRNQMTLEAARIRLSEAEATWMNLAGAVEAEAPMELAAEVNSDDDQRRTPRRGLR